MVIMKHVLVALILIFCLSQTNYAIKKVCFDKSCFKVKIAKTAEQRRIGLTQHKALGKNQGMLFLYPTKGFYSYWMKGMRFPIDMIWLDETRQIITLYEGVPPCFQETCPVFSSTKQALYVLELSAASISRLNLKTGRVATFK